DALVMMGLSDAFNAQQADFSKMGEGDFVISNVMQKVRITVDTKGTEAAAVTMVGVDATAMPADQPVVLDFNRPFFYVIMDKETAMPLFMGTYNYAK
ncbi:MAG: serpin family protein, partial [Clostridiaceae bacterium]|nr:serpin family protein [Clostridiaceae bacterium]